MILTVAVRCRYCQGDLSQPVPKIALVESASAPVEPRAPIAQPPLVAPKSEALVLATPPVDNFEQRFLEFAYTSDFVINAPAVAYALKVPIEEATEKLEDLAARDVLIREVDARGSVFFQLPGRQQVKQAQAGNPPPAGVTFLAPTGAVGPYHYPPSPNALAPYAPHALDGTPPITAPAEGTALAALLVNTLCLPGLGSIIGGRASAGIGQLLLFLFGIPLCFVVVGAPMILSAWIWALITGIDIMNQSKAAQNQRRLSG